MSRANTGLLLRLSVLISKSVHLGNFATYLGWVLKQNIGEILLFLLFKKTETLSNIFTYSMSFVLIEVRRKQFSNKTGT